MWIICDMCDTAVLTDMHDITEFCGEFACPNCESYCQHVETEEV